MTVKATDPRSGFFTFIHHDVPVEYSHNIDNRISFIERDKPPNQRAGRLRYLTYVPEAKVPPEVREAGEAYGRTVDVYCSGQAPDATAHEKAWDNYANVLQKHRCQLLEIALEIVPDAPWDKAEDCLVFGKE